jgi:hypothetical protein
MRTDGDGMGWWGGAIEQYTPKARQPYSASVDRDDYRTTDFKSLRLPDLTILSQMFQCSVKHVFDCSALDYQCEQ